MMNDTLARQTTRTDLERHIRDTPVTGTPQQMRAAFARLAGLQPALPIHDIGGVPCAMAGDGQPGAIWLHGGGYVFGGVESHGHAITRLAARLGQAVVMPLYRLAPEATWPDQRHDALAVLNALPRPLPLIGDSAGGHLALHMAFAKPDSVTALALIGANTDRTEQSRTRSDTSDHDLMNDSAQDAALARMALPHAPLGSIHASPLMGPLDWLPRTYITCSCNEVLADDSLLLARAAGLAGVEVTLKVERDLFHMWTLWPHVLPEAAQTLDQIANWLREAR